MPDVTVTPETEVVSQKEVKKKQVYIDVEEIRKAYPNPRKNSELHIYGAYCVGGAFMLFLGKDNPFPGTKISFKPVAKCEHELPNQLLEINPRLPHGAILHGFSITSANDRGDFEGAWQALKEALEFGCDTSKETNDETRAAAQSPG